MIPESALDVSEKSAREIIAEVLKPGPIGEFADAPMMVACDIDEHLEQAGFTIVKAVPVDQWEIVVDEYVLIYVVHHNARYEKDEKRRRELWEGWQVGKWIRHNQGGWTYSGMCGEITHVAPLPERPR
jgi:hypothetical protein